MLYVLPLSLFLSFSASQISTMIHSTRLKKSWNLYPLSIYKDGFRRRGNPHPIFLKVGILRFHHEQERRVNCSGSNLLRLLQFRTNLCMYYLNSNLLIGIRTERHRLSKKSTVKKNLTEWMVSLFMKKTILLQLDSILQFNILLCFFSTLSLKFYVKNSYYYSPKAIVYTWFYNWARNEILSWFDVTQNMTRKAWVAFKTEKKVETNQIKSKQINQMARTMFDSCQQW